MIRLLQRIVLPLGVLMLSSCAFASGAPRVQVEPSCVSPGETATLTVTTDPGAFVMYQATYADGRSGAATPIGAGYGGNDGGRADEEGLYSSSWTVSSDTPAGTATVLVLLPEAGHGDDGPLDRPADAVAELEAQFAVSEEPGQGCG